jgi:hypothetical protein
MYSANNPQILQSQVQWVLNNISNLNIQFVTHTGNITNDGSNVNLWESVCGESNQPNLKSLPSQIPCGYSTGLKDSYISNGVTKLSLFDDPKYFHYRNFETYSWYLGHYDSTNDCSYQIFQINGVNYLILHLCYSPSPDQLQWARVVLDSYPSHRVIISTNSYLNIDGGYSNSGVNINHYLVNECDNVFLILSGNSYGTFHRLIMIGDRKVHAITANYSGENNGGNGWLRVYQFNENSINVYSYSPTLNITRNDLNYHDKDGHFNPSINTLDIGLSQGSWSDIVTTTNQYVTIGRPWSLSLQLKDNNNNPINLSQQTVEFHIIDRYHNYLNINSNVIIDPLVGQVYVYLPKESTRLLTNSEYDYRLVWNSYAFKQIILKGTIHFQYYYDSENNNNLIIPRHGTWCNRFLITDDEGNAVNLAGYKSFGRFRPSRDSLEEILSPQSGVLEQEGVAYLSLSVLQTIQLPNDGNTYYYDLYLTNDKEVIKVSQGSLTFKE